MVADLLRQSMAAHDRAKQLRHRGSKGLAREALLQARSLRVQALAEDPERTDHAWTDEQVKTPKASDTHTALMAFYAAELDET